MNESEKQFFCCGITLETDMSNNFLSLRSGLCNCSIISEYVPMNKRSNESVKQEVLKKIIFSDRICDIDAICRFHVCFTSFTMHIYSFIYFVILIPFFRKLIGTSISSTMAMPERIQLSGSKKRILKGNKD